MLSIGDVAIGADSAVFGLTETRLGLIPATIGPYVCARMGEARARRVFMSGRRFAAAEAVDLGVLAKAVPIENLDEVVWAEIEPYLSCAPAAVARAKATPGPRLRYASGVLCRRKPRRDDAAAAHRADGASGWY